MKKVTSFTHHKTAEGDRISFTFSEIDNSGNVVNQNQRENFVVVDPELISYINAINNHISQRLEG